MTHSRLPENRIIRGIRLKTLILAGLIISLFQFIAPLQAATSWNILTKTIQKHLNSGNEVVGNIVLVQGATAIIKLQGQDITVGNTLVVKGKSLPGVPLSLQNNIAWIRITQFIGQQARGTILPGSQSIPPQSLLFHKGHNQVYLYSNLAEPQHLKAYQDLTRALQNHHIPYTIKTWPQLCTPDTPGITPLIIIFETEGKQAFCRLSDRDQNIFFQNSFALNLTPATTRKAGGSFSQTNSFNNVSTPPINREHSFTKATSAAPGTRPYGKVKLKNPYNRLIFADFDKETGPELILLNNQWLELYHLINLKLIPVTRYHLPKKDFIPLHLHAGDFNHNGQDELYLTLGRPTVVDGKKDTFLSSIIIENQGKSPKVLAKNLPYYFRVLEQRDGKRVLLAQKMGEFKQYRTPIWWAKLSEGKFEVRSTFRQGRDIFSLYNFNLSPFNKEHLLIIDEHGNLAGFNAKDSELIVSADSQYGVFDESPYNQKLKEIEYEGGFSVTKSSDIRYTARRFVKRKRDGQQIFIIKKGRAVNPSLGEKGVALVSNGETRHDQIIGLQWRNDEIIESWKSPKLPRDIVDFAFTKESDKELMVVMTRNRDGKYALELLH